MRPRYFDFRTVKRAHALAVGLSLVVAVSCAATAATAQTESVIYSFPAFSLPQSRPLEDPTGAFFVAVPNVNAPNVIYKILENKGVWKGHKIFRFKNRRGTDLTAGVVSDPDGVLYGVAQNGGAYGYGAVYALKSLGGYWKETVLHDFTGGADGARPTINVVRDKASGTLYGTANSGGGVSNCGTIFSLVPSNGNWTFNTLYSFAGGSDGCIPGVAIHPGAEKGTYFSTTFGGGARGAGTVFELVEKNGVWTESIIYSFTGGNDGEYPQDLDIGPGTDNLFGVAASGGAFARGNVFELSKNGHNWSLAVLYSFSRSGDGSSPVGLHLEKAGELFGTTEYGGAYNYGTLFKLVKRGGSWSETVLHSFGATAGDGLYPQSRPIEDSDTGVLYGTTSDGGQYNGGTLYTVVD